LTVSIALTTNLDAKKKIIHRLLITAAVVCCLILSGYVYRQYLWEKITSFYHLFSDREQVKAFVASFGRGAPVIFIIIQILQVIFAPFPGEATGFIGGFLFGTVKGFLYSTIGLTLGSWINFSIGRFMGKRFVRKLIPEPQLDRLDQLIKHQGVIVLFIFFIIPGFPKDYLCLFLGLSAMPLQIFLIITGIGRMPGTLMLSLQGSYFFEGQYGPFAMIMALCLMVIFLAYKYREPLYQWLEKFNGK
jgi:uncharacterized membrane protein YdjX (TVP38/TMEM64 family)